MSTVRYEKASHRYDREGYAPQTRREPRRMSPLKAEHERLLHLHCRDLSSAILFSMIDLCQLRKAAYLIHQEEHCE